MPVDLNQVAKLVHELEEDLARAKGDEASVRKLLDEVETIKSLLAAPAPKHSRIRESLHAMRDTMTGEMWRDAPYLTEIGRILGMT